MNDKLQCQLCYQWFGHLGSHVWHKHKITARDYKIQFDLDFKTPLISQAIKQKKHDRFEEDREKYLKNLEAGKYFRFKKGVSNRTRIAQESIDRATATIESVNGTKHGTCPVCQL